MRWIRPIIRKYERLQILKTSLETGDNESGSPVMLGLWVHGLRCDCNCLGWMRMLENVHS